MKISPRFCNFLIIVYFLSISGASAFSNDVNKSEPDLFYEEYKEKFKDDLEILLKKKKSFYQRHKGKIWAYGVSGLLILGAVVVTVYSGGGAGATVPASVVTAKSIVAAETVTVISGVGMTLASGVVISAMLYESINDLPSTFEINDVMNKITIEIEKQEKEFLLELSSEEEIAKKLSDIAKEVLDNEIKQSANKDK